MQNDTFILIVEDEPKIAASLKQGLQETGFDVAIAFDGITGEKMFEGNAFDLILLDINLPGLNGLELCKRIRQKNKQIPILMLTTFGSVVDKVDGFNAGADDYLLKPFSFDELIVRIRALLRRTSDQVIPTGNLLSLSDLEMNLDTKTVFRNGTSIQLTAKEFLLLEYLMRNRNRIVSRADIAEHVWNIDFDTNSNTIDVYVNYLRNKIDRNFDQKLIHTKVGFGYIMKESI